jgi:surface protein
MFKFKSLDLSTFNSKNLVKMNNMFSSCYDLISINISSFDTSKCQHDHNTSIFQECESLQEIIINKRDLEFFMDELKKSNMELNDTIKIDSGTVFKYDDQYYLRTSKDKVVKLDNVSAREAYESLK